MKHLFIIFSLLFFFISYPILHSQQNEEIETRTTEFETVPQKDIQTTRSFYMEFINMLFTLGLIVVVLLIISWLFKRMMHTRMQQINVTSVIKILETRAVSAKLSLHLIAIQDKGIVFAESSVGIEKLAEIDLTEQTERSFRRILEDKIDHPDKG